MIDRWWLAFAVGWAAQIVVCSWREWMWRRRHAADLRLLRHMAEGQAELQRELSAVRGLRAWVDDVGCDGPAGRRIAAVRASREVH